MTTKAKPTKKATAPATKAPTKNLTTKKPRKPAATTNQAKPARASAQPTAAPGAIPVGGTDTQVQAMGVTTQEKALALGKQYLPAGKGEGLSEAEAYSLKPDDVDNSTLARVTDRFNGVEMTEVQLPQSEAMPAVVYTGAAPAFAEQPAPTEEGPKTPVADAFGSAEDQRATPPPAKRQAAVGMHFAQRVTRLKMTLHGLEALPGDETNPLTRCSFGAVYSADEMTEDSVYGKATPYANLQYNVRSDLAAGLEVGQAYFIDIQKVPS